MADHVQFQIGGRKVNPRTIKAEVVDAYNETIFQSVSALAADLQAFIDKLSNRSTNRGRGFYAIRYNRPIEGAEVYVDEDIPGEKYTIGVRDDGPGTPGYKFNVLDSGIPERRAKTSKGMVFPVYTGKLTKAGENSTVTNRAGVKVAASPRFIFKSKVKKVTPRHFLEDIVKKRSKQKSPSKLKGRYRFVLDPADTKVRVVRS